MSFDVHLTAPGVSDEQARRFSELADERGTWPICWRRSRRVRRLRDCLRLTTRPAAIWFPTQTESGWSLTADEVVIDGSWDIEPRLRARLAASIRLLGDEFPGSVSLLVAWVGDELVGEVRLTSEELAALVETASVRDCTRYVTFTAALDDRANPAQNDE